MDIQRIPIWYGWFTLYISSYRQGALGGGGAEGLEEGEEQEGGEGLEQKEEQLDIKKQKEKEVKSKEEEE